MSNSTWPSGVAPLKVSGMAFISSTIRTTSPATPPSPVELIDPPMPALQAILNWFAAFALIPIFFIWITKNPMSNEGGILVQVGATAACVFIALILFGIGQVIGYLGTSAYYARLTYEHLVKNPMGD